MRRSFQFDKYDTWHDWRLTLTAKDVAAPEPKTNYVDLDGAHGTLDLSEALTGEVVYNDRVVTASFWSSEGTRQEREQTLREIALALHGRKVKIIEPDDPDHFLLGRVNITAANRTMVNAELSIEAICEPWRYAVNETERVVPVGGATSAVIRNNGAKTVTPVLTVTGTVTLTFNGASTELTAGSYKIADLRLAHGVNVVGLSGNGSVTFTYREADL